MNLNAFKTLYGLKASVALGFIPTTVVNFVFLYINFFLRQHLLHLRPAQLHELHKLIGTPIQTLGNPDKKFAKMTIYVWQ